MTGPVGTAIDSAPIGARVYSRSWRLIAAACVAASRLSLIVIGVGLMSAAGPVKLPTLVRALTMLAALPALAGWLIARTRTVDLEVRDGQVVLHGASLRIEIPCAAIERVVPWMVPLPGPGFSFWMRSGRRLPYGVQASDPAAILMMLADAGGVERVRSEAAHPLLVYAQAKQRVVHRRWYHPLFKFGVFAWVPTAVWFNAHQHIAYGGVLGQYYLEGAVPYLKTLAITWGFSAAYLILYASAWRAAAEGGAIVTAWLAPAHATGGRRAAEVVCRVVYYGGVPLLVSLPFLM